MRDLNGTDVRMLAKGYWDNYFNWRIHPRAKVPAIMTGAAMVLLVILAAVSWGVEGSNPTLAGFLLVSGVTFMVSALWTAFASLRERDHFLDAVQHLWETSKAVPDRTTVTDYVITGVLKGRK